MTVNGSTSAAEERAAAALSGHVCCPLSLPAGRCALLCWAQVTSLSGGDYLLRVELNAHRQIAESSYDNNVAVVSIRLPD